MTDWLLSIVWYSSALVAAIGLTAAVRPMRRLKLATRRRGLAVVAACALVLVGLARVLPSPTRVGITESLIDEITPIYQFRERHSVIVAAPPQRVLAAVKAVTADEIALFQAFTAIRRFGTAGPESILNAPGRQPILDVATRSGFVLLADTDREVVVGTIVSAPAGYRSRLGHLDAHWFRSVADSGVVTATMSFHAMPHEQTSTNLVTETRVFATDQVGLRRFTWYWRTIFPGSWILRVTWLKAIAHRAEA
jgi:hypothetical protein